MDERQADVNAGRAGSTGDQDAARSDQIRADIAQTRAELDETVNALQDRLQPEHLVNQAMEMFKDTANQVGHAVWDHVKENPLPYALIGVGAIWLLSGRGTSVHAYGHWRDRHDGQEGRTSPAMGAGSDSMGAGAQAGAQRPAVSFREAHGLREKASALAAQTTYAAAHAREVAVQKAHEAKEWTAHSFDEYPLAVGAAAFAAGLAAGLAIPITRSENELMGETRDHLWEEAKHRGQDLVERGKKVATTAVEAAKQKAQAEGLEPGAAAETLKDKTQRVAHRATEAAKQEAKRQDLTS